MNPKFRNILNLKYKKIKNVKQISLNIFGNDISLVEMCHCIENSKNLYEDEYQKIEKLDFDENYNGNVVISDCRSCNGTGNLITDNGNAILDLVNLCK